jgi:Mycothiol maleylpyruvate isomerase N-terminal domain
VNASDILKYGHLTLMHEIEGLDDWDTPGVVGAWTAKDLLAHLASYEHLIAEALQGFVGGGDTPYMKMMGDMGGETFNDKMVEVSRGKSLEEVMNDYATTHEQMKKLFGQIPAETFPQTGTLPWYGAEYSLDDYIVYSQYGHKREHSAQFAMFRDRLKRG